MSGEQFEQFVKHCGVSLIHLGHGWWSSHGVHYACDGDGLPLGLSFPTGNTEQAITRTAEQSYLVALAERDALTAQVEALTSWKARATDLLRFFTDDPDDCRLDHNGDCQTHLGGNPCTWAEARTFLNGGDQ